MARGATARPENLFTPHRIAWLHGSQNGAIHFLRRGQNPEGGSANDKHSARGICQFADHPTHSIAAVSVSNETAGLAKLISFS